MRVTFLRSTPLPILAALSIIAVAAASASSEELVRRQGSWPAITELELSAGPADVEIRSASSSAALAVETFDFPRDFQLYAERLGGKLTLRLRVPVLRLGLGLLWSKPRMVITLPRGILAELGSSSGSISIEGHLAPRLDLHTSSGGIEASEVLSDIRASSSSGSITIERCKGALELNSSSGDIVVASTPGAKKIATSSGSVELSGSTGDLAVETSSGSVTITGSEGRLAVTTTSGSVTIDKSRALAAIGTSSGSIRGKSLRLTGDSVFTTSSGEVELDLDNAASELRFELASSSGSLRAGSSRADRRLESGSGPILVRGRSTSGSQVYGLR